jgi:hypothetical protein
MKIEKEEKIESKKVAEMRIEKSRRRRRTCEIYLEGKEGNLFSEKKKEVIIYIRLALHSTSSLESKSSFINPAGTILGPLQCCTVKFSTFRVGNFKGK